MQIDYNKIVRAFEDNPVPFLGAASAVLIGIGKVIQAVGDSRGSHAYARDVNRRIRRDKRQR